MTGNKKVLLKDGTLIPPAWVQGQRVYGWSPDSRKIFCISQSKEVSEVLEIAVEDDSIHSLDLSPYSIFSQLSISPEKNDLCCLASSPTEPTSIIQWSSGSTRVIRSSVDISAIKDEISVPQPVEWTDRTGETIYGSYYLPINSKFRSDGLPPAVIHIHGGPTSQADTSFAFDTAFFTNRGYAYLAVNYRGSTGYGRDYQKSLNHHWGEYDVEDTISAAHYLIDNHLADPAKLVIKGSSAGGYTLLNTIIRYPDLFRAAICAYPVANLMTIIDESFKFEAHYYDSLIGAFPPEKDKYIDWSPINHVNKIHTPMILFHGDSDPVVPSSQSAQIVDALKANHVPHIYKLFSGEGHGWRKVKTIETYYKMINRFLIEYVLTK
jgi:dipeptidyl aminopeptidase/acylaminoacyl peptidase